MVDENARTPDKYATVIINLEYVVPDTQAIITRRFSRPSAYVGTVYQYDKAVATGRANATRLGALQDALFVAGPRLEGAKG